MSNIKLEELEAKYKELGEEIEKLKVNEPQKVWPRIGDEYWVVSEYSFDKVEEYNFEDDSSDAAFRSIGNFFRYKEEAIAEYEARKVITELKNCKGVKKFIVEEDNYCIQVNLREGTEVEYWNANAKGFGQVYFESEQYVVDAIEQVGEERIIKAAKWLSCGEYL